MKKLNFDSKNGRAHEEDILLLQARYNIKIPEDLATILLEANGGRSKENVFSKNSGEHFVVCDFISVSEDRNGSVESLIPLVNDERSIIEWIPFGFDPGGWIYCLNIESRKVHLFRMDKVFEENFDFMAESFEDFINNLKPESEIEW